MIYIVHWTVTYVLQMIWLCLRRMEEIISLSLIASKCRDNIYQLYQKSDLGPVFPQQINLPLI